MSDNLLYALALVVIVVILYNVWFRPEYLTDDEIAQSLITNAMISYPPDSTAVIQQMLPAERRKYEHMDSGRFTMALYAWLFIH